MNYIKHSNIFFGISGALFLASVLIWIALGLNLGIDFTGGSLLEIEYTQERPSQEFVTEQFAAHEITAVQIQPVGERGYNLRFADIDEETHQSLLESLQSQSVMEDDAMMEEGSEVELETEAIEGDLELEGITLETEGVDGENTLVEKRFTSVGPVIGQELKRTAVGLSIAVIIAIVLYIAWAFRKVSYPVQSWKYGIISIIALVHDVVITIGIFIILGKIYQLEINAPFVAAILTILGYSVNDTIVAFDRVRENLHRYDGNFEDIVDTSVRETVSRSINTSCTTLLVLFAIFIFGGESIKDFVLALIIGISLGTYSSIFIASPLLVLWQKLSWRLKKSHT